MTEAPAIGFSISVQIGDKLSIVAQTHVDQAASLSEINGIVDKIQSVMDRKALQAELEAWRKHKISQEINAELLAKDLVRNIEKEKDVWSQSGKRGEYHPSTQAINAQKTIQQQLENALSEAKIDVERIKECEAKLARLEKEPHLRVA